MNKRPMPEDFREHATEPIDKLAKRYRASRAAVRRWRDELGMPQKHYEYRPVEQIAKDGTVVKMHESAYYAALSLGKKTGGPNIRAAARNYPYRTAFGYRWRFV